MKYWIVVNGSRILVLESRGFSYTSDLHFKDIADIPRSEHIWIDMRRDLNVDSGRLMMLRNETPENAAIVITHYQRLLDYIKPDVVHVLYKGRIVKTAGPELALELEEKGYDWIKREMGD